MDAITKSPATMDRKTSSEDTLDVSPSHGIESLPNQDAVHPIRSTTTCQHHDKSFKYDLPSEIIFLPVDEGLSTTLVSAIVDSPRGPVRSEVRRSRTRSDPSCRRDLLKDDLSYFYSQLMKLRLKDAKNSSVSSCESKYEHIDENAHVLYDVGKKVHPYHVWNQSKD